MPRAGRGYLWCRCSFQRWNRIRHGRSLYNAFLGPYRPSVDWRHLLRSAVRCGLDQSFANIIIPGLPVQDHSGTWSVNYNFDQYLCQPDPKVDQGWGIFGRVGVSDGQANPMHWFFSAGIVGKGVIPGRKNDTLGLGYYHILAADAQSLNQLDFGDSYGGELFYEIEITRWMHLTPDFQMVKPSQRDVDCAAVLGIRLGLSF